MCIIYKDIYIYIIYKGPRKFLGNFFPRHVPRDSASPKLHGHGGGVRGGGPHRACRPKTGASTHPSEPEFDVYSAAKSAKPR